MANTTDGRVFVRTVKMYKNGPSGTVAIPAALYRPLSEKGYNAADLYVTDEGLLLVPCKAAAVDRKRADIDLPDW